LLRSLRHPHLWPVAGVDLMLLGFAFGTFAVSRRLSTSERRASSHVTILDGASSHA
jgi:hypothetical protein